VDLLAERAAVPFVLRGSPGVTECDLVAHATVGGEARGFLRESDGRFAADRIAEPRRTQAQLLALAEEGEPVTFLCAPPGAGFQMALDRDGDGALDRDEIDQGQSPIDRAVPTRPGDDPDDPDAGPVGPGSDGGSADAGSGGQPDGGVTDGGGTGNPATGEGGGGCGCRTGGEPVGDASLAVLALLAGAALRPRSSRRSRPARPGR
jgi:MYXO-CTERM domain-containing protein